MQRMSMKIHKHGVPDAYIYLSNFYAFSHASRAPSILFMKTAFYVLCYRKTTCKNSIHEKRKFMEFMMRKPLYFC